MKKAQLVHICGDFHGEWDRLNVFINQKIRQSKKVRALAAAYDELEVLILQCGDFGYWPHLSPLPECLRTGGRADLRRLEEAIRNQVDFLKDGQVKVYWTDGNHEDHDALDDLEAKHSGEAFLSVMPGVFFAPFGSILTLVDGTRVMFCGGAESGPLDIQDRVPGFSWWPQEGIDDKDMARLPDPQTACVDWIISHTGPHAFEIVGKGIEYRKNREPSKAYLDRILEDYRPKRWWFGHYHALRDGWNNGCRWMLLDRLGNGRGRKWMDTVLLTSEKTKEGHDADE